MLRSLEANGAGNVQVVHRNGLGSTRVLIGGNQNVIQTFQADEFGVLAWSRERAPSQCVTRASSAMSRAASTICGLATTRQDWDGSSVAIRSLARSVTRLH